MRRVTHAPTTSAGLRYEPDTEPTINTITVNAKKTTIAEPELASTTAASKNVPMNSAMDAASSGERLKLNFSRDRDVLAAALTVVTFVVVFATAGEALLTTRFFAVAVVFLVAIAIPSLKRIWLKYSTPTRGVILKVAMALFVNQENTRTKLQQRIAADLADKAKKRAADGIGDRPDGVDDSAYLKNTKPTTSLAWVWVAIVVAFIAVLVWLAVSSM